MSQFDTSLMFRYDASEQKVTEKSRRYILQAFLILCRPKYNAKNRQKRTLFLC
jgi:hypothetical protein